MVINIENIDQEQSVSKKQWEMRPRIRLKNKAEKKVLRGGQCRRENAEEKI
jgi:hypothetical protein